ncbi:hypothetical protein ACWD5R_26680 [Streptomyces sp. NPDC002514]|uniref:hypothetical protein n=1 Tax=Streptomyces sp. NPDC001270 TaxID=3364554 RepID=UPI00367853BD
MPGKSGPSGFLDDYAFEDWLFRLEQLEGHEERLAAGEHVGGPAADTYRHRVHTALTRFAGRVVTAAKQAHDPLDNPLLQIPPAGRCPAFWTPTRLSANSSPATSTWPRTETDSHARRCLRPLTDS